MTTLRTGLMDAARRAYLGLTRGTLVSSDEKPKLQELTIRSLWGDKIAGVEHWHRYGLRYCVPEAKGNDKHPDVLVAFLGGNSSHPVAIATADRRYRPNRELKPGEIEYFDDQGQFVRFARDGVEVEAPVGKYVRTKVGNATLKVENGKITATVGNATMTIENGKITGIVAGKGQFVAATEHAAIKIKGRPDLHVTVDDASGNIIAGKEIVTAPDPYPND